MPERRKTAGKVGDPMRARRRGKHLPRSSFYVILARGGMTDAVMLRCSPKAADKRPRSRKRRLRGAVADGSVSTSTMSRSIVSS